MKTAPFLKFSNFDPNVCPFLFILVNPHHSSQFRGTIHFKMTPQRSVSLNAGAAEREAVAAEDTSTDIDCLMAWISPNILFLDVSWDHDYHDSSFVRRLPFKFKPPGCW